MTVSRHGLLLLNKKSGVTSFDSLRDVKRAFATGKVGHTGTLDKFASGLLLVLVGRGVKLAPLFDRCTKEYVGTVRFGGETDTLDPEGTVIARGSIPSREDLEVVLPAFRGNILQAPPAFSALHINGRRAYELVREGREPEMKRRPVTVFSLEILSWEAPDLVLSIRCSAGTYIRSLARDLAIAAGTRASLTALTRTRVGEFRLEDAVDLSNDVQSNEGDGERLVKALRPLDRKLFEALSLPYFLVEGEAAEGFLHGKPLKGILALSEAEGTRGDDMPAAGVFKKNPAGESDVLLGVLKRQNDGWSYGHVFADS